MFKDLKTQALDRRGLNGWWRSMAMPFCMRYRYDKARVVRLKTVEIIVEEKAVSPTYLSDGEIVPVAVEYTGKALRDMLKAAGGRWDPQEKVWHVAHSSIRGTDRGGYCRLGLQSTRYGNRKASYIGRYLGCLDRKHVAYTEHVLTAQ